LKEKRYRERDKRTFNAIQGQKLKLQNAASYFGALERVILCLLFILTSSQTKLIVLYTFSILIL